MKSSKKKSPIIDESKLINAFRTMIDSCPLWLSFVNPDGQYIIANDYYTKTFNLPKSKIEGHNFKDFFPPYLYEKHKRLIEKCFKKRKPIEWQDQHNFEKKQTVYIYGIYTPLFHDDGSRKGLVAFGVDISELKKTKFKLIEQRDLLEKKVIKRTKELQKKNIHLEESNIALKVLLQHRESDKKEIERSLQIKFEKLVFPYLARLRSKMSHLEESAFIDIIESNLNEILSPFFLDSARNLLQMTPAEMQIVDLIKNGKSTKEIATLLKLSPTTISTHRQNIRKKLNLTNKKMNLKTALLSN